MNRASTTLNLRPSEASDSPLSLDLNGSIRSEFFSVSRLAHSQRSRPVQAVYNECGRTFHDTRFDDTAAMKIFHPLLALIASAVDRQLARYVEFLKEENKILRARIPGQIHTRPGERQRLAHSARPLMIGNGSCGTALLQTLRTQGPRSQTARAASARTRGAIRFATNLSAPEETFSYHRRELEAVAIMLIQRGFGRGGWIVLRGMDFLALPWASRDHRLRSQTFDPGYLLTERAFLTIALPETLAARSWP